MNIGFIANNSKKSLLETFCIAYKDVYAGHELYAPESTARVINDVTGLKVHKFLNESVGGDIQFAEMLENGRIDMVFMFYTPAFAEINEPDRSMIIRACVRNNIPLALNLSTADAMMLALQRGDFSYLDESGGFLV